MSDKETVITIPYIESNVYKLIERVEKSEIRLK